MSFIGEAFVINVKESLPKFIPGFVIIRDLRERARHFSQKMISNYSLFFFYFCNVTAMCLQ